MTQKSNIAVITPTGNWPGTAAPEIRRQQQREQTLEWVSRNALSTLRRAWRKAKLGGSGIDCALGSATSAE
jgi:hypothetical protein